MRFKGIKNFRDLGDIRTESRNKIEKYKLYRSDYLYKASRKDLRLLKEKYRVSLVIDLRDQREIDEAKDKIIDGAEYINIPFFETYKTL